jgi:hypothetical protein
MLPAPAAIATFFLPLDREKASLFARKYGPMISHARIDGTIVSYPNPPEMEIGPFPLDEQPPQFWPENQAATGVEIFGNLQIHSPEFRPRSRWIKRWSAARWTVR